MRSKEHIVGKQARATVRKFKDEGGLLHAQTRPQETPTAKAASKDKSRQWGHTIQYTGDMLAGYQHGCTSDIQGAPQPLHEESHGSRM